MKNIQSYMRLLVLCLCFTTVGCDTEIPATDSEPPTFLFRITGDGFNQEFNQDTDFDSFQLNLREDVDYDFIFSAGDSGGMKQIQWQYGTDYLEHENAIPSPWAANNVGLSTFITWRGDINNPLTGMILNGTFRTNGDGNSTVVSHDFTFMAEDFGGAASMENRVYGSLNILTGNHLTEIINF